MEEHRLPVKVYLEDTDAQGIVYHANYLKYCERARTEVLARCGYTLGEMQTRGYIFVVYEMKLRFQRPARLHDELEVRSTVERTTDYRVTFKHRVLRRENEEPIFVAEAQVVTIDPAGELRPLPDDLLR
ncbi:MAG: YbgC/FadM family acyl-CoA thioesterase [Deltaproteobacteria bacterium]|nr:YbgC/FadM family acyl-CoA thioesterase [Deltaproteobacteria bacterium]